MILRLYDEVEKLSNEIKRLKEQLAKNSANSSKPPSSDGLKKRPIYSNRKKSRRKPGGQRGHHGEFLKPVSNPDEKDYHFAPSCTCGCNKKKPEISIETRQVFDIPKPKVIVTEHFFEVAYYPCCGARLYDKQLDDLPRPAQYGKWIKSSCVYLMHHQHVPYDRMVQLCRDLFDTSLSAGTLYNWNKKAYHYLDPFEKEAAILLKGGDVIGADETSANISGKLYWLHSFSNAYITLIFLHKNRGQKAMEEIGILKNYHGTIVHDFWKAYYKFLCKHALCNAHLLRELTFIFIEQHQLWASNLIALLLKIKKRIENAKISGRESLSERQIEKFEIEYDKIIRSGSRKNPEPEKIPGKRGRPKRTTARNLVRRLIDHKHEILCFLHDFRVPFDNNGAERTFRMAKVHLKISGCFRSIEGGVMFARIRSYIDTCRKQKRNILLAITEIFNNKTSGIISAE